MPYSFKGKLIKVATQRRRLPNGRLVNLEIIKHPGAALIIPFLDKNRIVVIRQFRAVINSYLYELPAGTLNPKERPLACAKREVIEEAGYASNHITLLGKIYPVPGYSTEIIWIFKADKLKKAKISSDPDEIIKVCVFNRAQVRNLFAKKKIVDAKTISALVFCGWL